MTFDLLKLIFAFTGRLNQHINNMHNPAHTRRVFACTEPNCTYSALTNQSLKDHMATFHSTSTYFKFKCSRCSQGFRRGSQLRHHSGFCCDPAEKPHLCANCGKRFRLKQHLELHYSGVHKMGPEAARALVYPGLSPHSWLSKSRSGSGSSSSRKSSKELSSKKKPRENETENEVVPVAADPAPFFLDKDFDMSYLQL